MLTSPLRRRNTRMSVTRLATSILMIPLVLTGCGGGTSPAREPTAAAPAASSQVLMQLRSDWQAQKDMMMKIADAMPENKFPYKSTPPQRSYGEQIMHVASSNVELLKILDRSEEHTSELQSLRHLVCRLLLEKK